MMSVDIRGVRCEDWVVSKIDINKKKRKRERRIRRKKNKMDRDNKW
jgi:hypothetical protein